MKTRPIRPVVAVLAAFLWASDLHAQGDVSTSIDGFNGIAWGAELSYTTQLPLSVTTALPEALGQALGFDIPFIWALIFGALGVWGIGRLPTAFIPDEDQGYVMIGAQLPDGASLERTGATDVIGEGNIYRGNEVLGRAFKRAYADAQASIAAAARVNPPLQVGPAAGSTAPSRNGKSSVETAGGTVSAAPCDRRATVRNGGRASFTTPMVATAARTRADAARRACRARNTRPNLLPS